MRNPSREEMVIHDLSGVIIGVNWKTGESFMDFIAGEDVEDRCAASVEAYHNSAGWADWIFTYMVRP